MEEPNPATRVEIELTTNDDSRPRRRKSSPATADVVTYAHGSDTGAAPRELEAQLPPESDPPPNTIERRKLVVGAAAVAIVALFVGWALGRSGGSSPAEEAQPQATTAGSSPAETPPLAEIPTTVPITTTRVTVRPRSSPTTTVPEWETSTVEVDPALGALDIDVVLVGGGRLADIDTGSGEMQTLATRQSFQQQPLVNAGADWIVIRNFDDGGAKLVGDGELPVIVSIGDPWSTHFEPSTGLFLSVAETFGTGERTQVREFDHNGHETGRSFELPAGVWPLAADPAGGVVAAAPGGTYQVGLGGVRRITTGNLIALNERIAVVTDCGDDFSTCGLFVVDRASGQRNQLDVILPESAGVDGLFNLQSAAYWGFPGLMATISPDDRWAPVLITSGSQQFGLIDLLTGQVVVIAANPPSALWWSPDGRFALYNANGRLMLFDTASGSRTDALPSEGGVEAFAVRPSV